MKAWLNKQYLNPKGIPYRIIETLNQYFILIAGLIALFLLLIPTFNLISNSQQEKQLQHKNQQLNDTLQQKEKLFISIQTRQKKLNSQDTNISQINQKLDELFNAYHIENENIQWDFEQGKSITMTLTHKTASLFSLIDKLTTFTNLRIKELTLRKLEENRLVQLNITLQLVAFEEE